MCPGTELYALFIESHAAVDEFEKKALIGLNQHIAKVFRKLAAVGIRKIYIWVCAKSPVRRVRSDVLSNHLQELTMAGFLTRVIENKVFDPREDAGAMILTDKGTSGDPIRRGTLMQLCIRVKLGEK
jgi:hypothetical protein